MIQRNAQYRIGIRVGIVVQLVTTHMWNILEAIQNRQIGRQKIITFVIIMPNKTSLLTFNSDIHIMSLTVAQIFKRENV